eukprot:1024348-Pelagomonas_calceolata.AAC.1
MNGNKKPYKASRSLHGRWLGRFTPPFVPCNARMSAAAGTSTMLFSRCGLSLSQCLGQTSTFLTRTSSKALFLHPLTTCLSTLSGWVPGLALKQTFRTRKWIAPSLLYPSYEI